MAQKMMVTVHDDLYGAVKAKVHETGIPYAVVVRRALEYWVKTGLMLTQNIDNISHRQLMAADLMQLPLDERRRLLAIQAKEMAAHYAATTDEREAWQGGDVVEY
jgi:hypothetical protein